MGNLLSRPPSFEQRFTPLVGCAKISDYHHCCVHERHQQIMNILNAFIFLIFLKISNRNNKLSESVGICE